jgi:Flp pilus assembly protein TadG
MRHYSKSRRGATAVEFAIVGPLTFLLLLGLVIGGMGVFRYQEIASLAREGSRWASVHGTGYQKDTGKPAATKQDVINYMAAKGVSLDLSQFNTSNCLVTWNTNNSPYHTNIVNGQVVAVTNTVNVKITYRWIPEAYLGGITLTSTSESAMSN